jgi:hypothetical protein
LKNCSNENFCQSSNFLGFYQISDRSSFIPKSDRPWRSDPQAMTISKFNQQDDSDHATRADM